MAPIPGKILKCLPLPNSILDSSVREGLKGDSAHGTLKEYEPLCLMFWLNKMWFLSTMQIDYAPYAINPDETFSFSGVKWGSLATAMEQI